MFGFDFKSFCMYCVGAHVETFFLFIYHSNYVARVIKPKTKKYF